MKNLVFLILSMSFLASCEHSHEHTHDTPNSDPIDLYDYDVEKRIEEIGIVLPELSAPVANYVHSARTGNLVFLAGKGPSKPEGGYVAGKVGQDLSVEEGYEAAKLVAAAQLSALKMEIGDLNKVVRVVKVLGMVNCTSDFTDQPEVINGFSDTIVEVFGDRGKHARAAVGMGSLPRNIAVEIEMIVEVQE